ncbi:hypothetical protein CI777_11445, partial [Acinetobacter baumannii]
LKRWLLHKYLKIRTTLPFVYLCNKALVILKIIFILNHVVNILKIFMTPIKYSWRDKLIF